MKTKMIGLVATGLAVLCLGLCGCAEINAEMAAGTEAQGTVVAVNAADKTIVVQPDQGGPLTICVTDTTKLWKPMTFGNQDIAFDQITVGKYIVFKYAQSQDGKLTTIYVLLFNDKSDAPKPQPMIIL